MSYGLFGFGENEFQNGHFGLELEFILVKIEWRLHLENVIDLGVMRIDIDDSGFGLKLSLTPPPDDADGFGLIDLLDKHSFDLQGEINFFLSDGHFDFI